MENKIKELEQELEKKEARIKELEKLLEKNTDNGNAINVNDCAINKISSSSNNFELDLLSIKRYSRQLILPEIGPRGQKTLLQSSVLIVGCGGLGCPAAAYLSAAGVGTLGFVDYDDVEISNLHRQILHSENGVGESKVDSIISFVKRLNSSVCCKPHYVAVNSENILDIVKCYDVVLDCTDNVASRYLLNDSCIMLKKILVSGSALRFEGQLTIYGYEGGPCCRCLFPLPPPPETVTNCSDGGVLGVVPGIIGSLQALETIKIITKIGERCVQKLLLFDALNFSFRVVKLRGRKLDCAVCGDNPTITKLIDYEQFCGAKATDKDKVLNKLVASERISVLELKNVRDNFDPHILIDVRNPVELEICKLSNSVNIPLKLINDISKFLDLDSLNGKKLVCVCLRGNDSQKAVLFLKQTLPHVEIIDVEGGLTEWAKVIDSNFPIY